MTKQKSPQIISSKALHGANNKLNHAIIGVGLMGQHHIDYLQKTPDTDQLVAICDVHKTRLNNTLKRVGKDCKAYTDFREMLWSEDIDIVHIVTPPHWHTHQSIYSMLAGCDVWCEKPMARTIDESIAICSTVQHTNQLFRMNTWLRLYGNYFGMHCLVAPLKKLIASGALGWPLTVRVSPFTGFDWKVAQWCGKPDLPEEKIPSELDYISWLGPAPYKPYTTHRTSPSFRGYWDYDGGGLADMAPHYLDAVQYLLDKDDTSPIEVEANAPWPQHPDAVGLWGQVYLTYADGCKIIMESGEWGENETEGKPFIEGPNGKIYPGLRTEPASLATLADKLPDPPQPIVDFSESVRTRTPFPINESTSLRSNALIALATTAIRCGRKLRFNPVTLTFINDPAADSFISEKPQLPWPAF